jgi:hypothetical protein
MNAVRIDRRVTLVVLAVALVALGLLIAFSSGGLQHAVSGDFVEYGVTP